MMKKILIVDDNNHLSLFLKKKLTDAGHEVITASNGLSAVKALADFTPDIILCDYFLPNINGDKLCRVVRRMEHVKDAYFAIMSAAAHELNLEPSDIGADALIAKGSFQDVEKHILAVIADADRRRHDRQDRPVIGMESAHPRQMTRELIGQYRHLQDVLDSIAVGIIELCAGRIVYINKPAMDILGKTQEQILSSPLPDPFDDEAGKQAASFLGSDPPDHLIVELKGNKERAGRILSLKRLPFDDDPDTVILLIEDISERMRAEKILRDSHQYLEKLVQERTSDLKRVNEMLQKVQKMEAIGTMAGGIAHDFNNILSGMIGYMELAKAESRPDKQKHFLNQALQVSMRAKDMISQLLIFSRNQDQERKPIRLASLIRESIVLLRPILPSTIRIEQRIPEQPDVILGDATQIHQILMNLCTNAHHAMREKGGSLNIQLVREKVSSDGRPHPLGLAEGTYAKLTVSDTGHGIEPAILDRIFDPFFSTKGPGEGTGLGLSVVYGIVRDHGGKIDVTSEPGKGTAVSVFLPLIETGEPGKGVGRSTETIPTGNERILFIDDEVTITEVAKEILTSLGYRVTAKQSSTEALDLFRVDPHSFDLVITDMTMPGIRGDHLARELLKLRPDIPIIICTGFSEMMSEERAKTIGIRQFIMKPLYITDMARIIRKVLD